MKKFLFDLFAGTGNSTRLYRTHQEHFSSLKNLNDLCQKWHILYGLSIRYLIFDKDNCLTLPEQPNILQEYQESWSFLKKKFKIAILSNSAGSLRKKDPIGLKAQQIEKNLGVPVILHQKQKPFCGKNVFDEFPMAHPSEIAIVGDRWFTDGILALKNGFHPIIFTTCPDPLLDSVPVQWIRRIENWMFRQ